LSNQERQIEGWTFPLTALEGKIFRFDEELRQDIEEYLLPSFARRDNASVELSVENLEMPVQLSCLHDNMRMGRRWANDQPREKD
jgi:hypothetical protein